MASKLDPWDPCHIAPKQDNTFIGDPWDSGSETGDDDCTPVVDSTFNEDVTWDELLSDSEDESDKDPEGMLAQYLKQLYFDSVLSATVICVICFYCKLCGMGGIVAKLALRPDSSSGHFARKVKRVFKLNRKTKQYFIKCPGHAKASMGRRVHKLPTIPVHESLQRECIAKPGMEDIVAKAYADGQLPSCYTSHPVAIKNAFRSIPGAIYIDGLPTTKRDGEIGRASCRERV